MTSNSRTHSKPPPVPHTHLRLRLKPQGSAASGYVDGAWWPRSRDLTAELAELAEALAVRLGTVERVAYALSAWNVAPRKADVVGFRVRLEGFTHQDRNVIHVTGSNRGRISILVVPPEMTEPAGDDAMMAAVLRDNADRPEEILTAATVPTPREAHRTLDKRPDSDDGGLRRRD